MRDDAADAIFEAVGSTYLFLLRRGCCRLCAELIDLPLCLLKGCYPGSSLAHSAKPA